jgi:hypothetical protein
MRASFKAVLAVLILAILGAVSSVADATSALFLSREELVARSMVVARVSVGKAVTTESDDGASIVTRTEITVKQFLKGEGPKTFVVEQIGGTYKGKTQRIVGDAVLTPGEDAVVFLRVGEKNRAYFTALALSAYHVDAGGMVRRDLKGLNLMQRQNGKLEQVHAPAEGPETVEHLMTDVVRIAGGK